METSENKLQKALSNIAKSIKIIEYFFAVNFVFFVFTIFHSIWFFNILSFKLFVSSVVTGLIILFVYWIYKQVEKDFKNLKQK